MKIEIKDLEVQEMKVNFHLYTGLYASIKMYLRGINSLAYTQPIIGKLQQAKIGTRVAVEITDPALGKYTVVAVRKSETTGYVVTGWTANTTDVGKRARELLEVAYQVVLENGLSSWDIKREKTCQVS
jgi:hypothetical protein